MWNKDNKHRKAIYGTIILQDNVIIIIIILIFEYKKDCDDNQYKYTIIQNESYTNDDK